MHDTSHARTVEDLPRQFNAAVDLIRPNLEAGRGSKAAVIDCNGATSYALLAERIDRMADGLRAAGVAREQRVLLCLLDTVDFPTAFLGAITAGIVPVPLNTLLTAEDYRWMLADSRAAAVIVSGELSGRWMAVAAEFPQVRFFSSGDGPWPPLEGLLAAARPRAEPADTHRGEPAFWLYTSGSTGRPKGAMHSHAAMRLSANLFGIGVAGYGEGDVVLSVAKEFFAYGLGNAIGFPYASGATVVLHKDRATPQTIGALMKRHRVTIFNGVPTFFAAFMADAEAPSHDEVPSLRIATSAGESLPRHIGEAFHARYGVDVIDGLGSTEMLHIYVSQRPGTVRYGSTGRPVPGYEVRIMGDDGTICAAGEVGELQVKGPTAAMGYWNNRPRSAATFQGEWTRTGDKYRCDDEGWYSYVGRADDMLKVGGVYVSPAEVEEALACHPSVLEAAVVGAPDGDGLIKPRAYVVLRSGQEAGDEAAAALKAHVKAILAPYKYPRWIVFVGELPKTATGKIQRFRLRACS